MTKRALRRTGDETPDARARRLARTAVEVARKIAPDAPCDDEALESFWLDGYRAACLDMYVIDIDEKGA